MTLKFIRKDTAPTYIALSSDIVTNQIAGASIIGGTVFLTDTGDWKVISDDLTLENYTLPVVFGGSITIGTVTQGNPGSNPWLVSVVRPSISHGVSGVPFTSVDQSGGVASITDAPTSGQKIVVTDIFVSVDSKMAVTFKEETSGTVISGPYYLSVDETLHLSALGKMWKLATANKKLQVVTSASGNIMVDVGYYSEA